MRIVADPLSVQTPDMPQPQRKAVLQSWRTSHPNSGPRFLVIFDVNVKPPEIPWSPLVINFDLPRSVEGYAQRAAAAVPPPNARGQNGNGNANGTATGASAGGSTGGGQVNGVIVSFVQAAGGDVEMLRSTECAYRFKVGGTEVLPCNMRGHSANGVETSLQRYLRSSMTCSSIK
jgi:hypothetical protein